MSSKNLDILKSSAYLNRKNFTKKRYIMSRQALKNDGIIDPDEFAAAIATVDRQAKAKTIITKNYPLFKRYREEEYSFQNIVDVIKKVMSIKISESGFRKAYRALEKKRAEEAAVKAGRQNAIARAIPTQQVEEDVIDEIDVSDVEFSYEDTAPEAAASAPPPQAAASTSNNNYARHNEKGQCEVFLSKEWKHLVPELAKRIQERIDSPKVDTDKKVIYRKMKQYAVENGDWPRDVA
jgi:hypothetical protein